MKDLIEALTIFLKYRDVYAPTNCSHDVLAIMAVTEAEVTPEDTKRLNGLGFFYSEGEDCWMSFRFGSA